MDGLFKVAGIYSHEGQKYRPVDADSLLPYREASDGQILQEGICEVGAMASFMAAGSAYAVHGLPMIPFYIFYSMFGMQRVGDMIWGCADMMCKGFLLGGTAGRTTLNGEGLQHQDGHSHVLASTVPSLLSYDPAFGYELAIIVREGLRRMYVEQEDIFYYLTLYNENYLMPDMADVLARGALTQDQLVQGVLDGGYCFDPAQSEADIHLLASGSILQQAIRAKTELQALGYEVSLWSMTSYVELQRDAFAVAAANRQNPQAPAQVSKVEAMFDDASGAIIAVTDYMASLAQGIAAWMPAGYEVLGTDGFGLSESRAALRAHFEVDADAIVSAALANLYGQGLIDEEKLNAANR
jgi:pyruvate dehydrogenase E1 component